MPNYRYRVVDVFTERPLEGNPLAVFTDAASLDDATMQSIAKELNLSETSFIVPATRPGSDIGVRIFGPTCELPFAGHPTIGTSYVLLDEGIVPKESTRFILDEKIGPVPVRVERQPSGRPLIWLMTPPIQFGATYDRHFCARALGLSIDDLLNTTPQIAGAGAQKLFVAVRDKDTVDRAWADSRSIAPLGDVSGVFVFTPTDRGAYSRFFSPGHGVAEDPATGSATGPLAAYMMRNGLASGADGTRLISEQGVKMGRPSVLHILIHGEQGVDGIEVGGNVAPLVEATMHLD